MSRTDWRKLDAHSNALSLTIAALGVLASTSADARTPLLARLTDVVTTPSGESRWHVEASFDVVANASAFVPLVSPIGRAAVEPAYRVAGFCRIPPAVFMMGSTLAYPSASQLPRHVVQVTRAFEIQETETTVAQWFELMEMSSLGFEYPSPSDYPIAQVSFFDVLEFANRKSVSLGLPQCYVLEDCVVSENSRQCERATFIGRDCLGYRLPTEAEWELAAGHGSSSCVPGFDFQPRIHSEYVGDCTEFAVTADGASVRWCGTSEVSYEGCMSLEWKNGSACAGPGPVREFPSNRFGLYGMNGNVHEFTTTRLTWPSRFPAPPLSLGFEVDPGYDELLFDRALESDSNVQFMAARGGAFDQPFIYACVYSRHHASPKNSGIAPYGFRLVRTLPAEP